MINNQNVYYNYYFKVLIQAKRGVGLEKLLNTIFNSDKYNNLVRPSGDDDLTYVKTELKLLQIDF